MPRKKGFSRIKINRDERSSYFVVDLKNDFLDEKNVAVQKGRWVFVREKAVAVVSLGKKAFTYLKEVKSRRKEAKNRKQEQEIKSRKERETDIIVATKSNNKIENRNLKPMDEFAVLSLLKLIIVSTFGLIKLVYKISYKTGWYFVCGLKFVYLVFASSFKFLLWPFRIFKTNKKIIEEKVEEKKEEKNIARKNLFIKFKKYFLNFGSNLRFILMVLARNLMINRPRKEYSKKIKPRKAKKAVEVLPAEEPRSRSYLLKTSFKFAILLFVLILPFKILSFYKIFDFSNFKGRVLGASEQAMGNLGQAKNSISQSDFEGASVNFSEASQNFLKAQDQIKNINDVFFSLLKIIPNNQARFASEGKNLLVAGNLASQAGSDLSLAVGVLSSGHDKNLIQMIDDFTFYGEKALGDIKALNEKLNEINIDNLPKEYREQISSLRNEAVIVENGLTEFIGLSDDMKNFLGKDVYEKKYLLVFQNNTEMRATGGFLGSYALVNFNHGQMTNLEVPGGGSYDTEGGLTVLEKAPKPLWLVNPLWHFWDANWWPDWPTSAQKLMWFYDRSGGPTVDGVISFTPTVIEDLLKVIGPIDMNKDYNVVLTSDNFWQVTQDIVENKDTIYQTSEQSEIDKNKNPKKFIGDLMAKIIQELPKRLNKEKFVKILSVLENDLSEKHILFYFTDKDLESAVKNLGWDGSVKDFKWDYLSVINTNIAGGKSDKDIKENINLSANVNSDGSVINTLTITRQHTGTTSESFAGVRNVDWMRIYVPAGSELLEASGFKKPADIYFEKPDSNWNEDPDLNNEDNFSVTNEPSGTLVYNESGKTVFANWSIVDPGRSVQITIKYKLPFKIAEANVDKSLLAKVNNFLNPEAKAILPYAIYFQKQSGSIGSQLNYSFSLPNNFKIVTVYPNIKVNSTSDFVYQDILNIDKYFAIFIKKQ